MPEFAFATLVTSDAYAKGAQVVAAALRELHRSPPTPPEVEFETVCIVTPETVDVGTLKALRRAFDVVIGVEVIDEDQTRGLALLGRPDLNAVLTKLHVFRLTQYSKIIFLDADVLPVRPLSHLFTLPYEFSAVPDVGWPDIFNTGMMVLTPGEDKFQEIRELVKSRGSWDGGDQGILNEWRGENWHRLSFTYNTTPTAAYTYAPAYERFGSKISVIHFIGPNKPWQSAPWRPPFARSSSTPTSPAPGSASPPETQEIAAPAVIQQSYAYDGLVDRWFDIYDRHVRPAEIVPTPSFQPQKYEPAWSAPSAPSGPAFSLEELRKLATEGSGKAEHPRNIPGSIGEGHYVTLPLEGRIDLMRQRPPSPEPKHGPPAPSAGSESHGPLAPATTPHTPTLHQPSLYVPAPTHHYPYSTGPSRPPSPPLVHWNPAVEPPPTTFVQNPGQHTIGGYYPNVWDFPASSHHQRQHSGHSHTHHDPYHHQPSPDHRHHDHHQHSQQQPRHSPRPHPHQHHHEESSHYHPSPPFDLPQRLPSPKPHEFFPVQSPPAIPRSIAHEYAAITASAPNLSKVSSVFPWETKPRALPGRVFPAEDRLDPALFYQTQRTESPRQPTFPTTDVKSVLTEQPPSESPRHSPSPIAVENHSPIAETKRLYEPGEREPGSLVYANAWDSIPSIQRYVSKLVKPPSISHLRNANASSPILEGRRSPPKVPGSRAEGRTEEEAEYGDDEEDTESNGEDTGRETPEPGHRKSNPQGGSTTPSSRGSRSRGGSIASGRGKVASTPSARVFRSQGVQTTPKSRSSIGVQVAISSLAVAPPVPSSTPHSSAIVDAPVTPTSARNSSIAASAPPIRTTLPTRPAGTKAAMFSPPELLSPRMNDTPTRAKPMGVTAPSTFPHSQHSAPPLPPAAGPQDRGMLDSPIQIRSPPDPTVQTLRQSAAAPQSPASPVGSTISHGTTGSTVVSPTMGPIMRRHRASSNATDPTLRASWMSTSSSATIVEPVANTSSPEGVIVQPRATRKFDPARGVEVFKRDSQEVLARFLRLGPWSEHTSEGSAAHSAA